MANFAALVVDRSSGAAQHRQVASPDVLLTGTGVDVASGTMGVGTSGASAITIGQASITTSFPGPVALNGGITTVGGTTFTTSATFQGDVTFGTDGGPDGPDTVTFVATVSSHVAMDGSAIDSGTATSGGASTLTDTGQAWTVNQYAGNLVQITGGTGIGQSRVVASNTTDTVTTTSPWAVAPDNTSTYEIIGESFKIQNLANPTLPHDAATKAYVDSSGGGATLQSAYVNGNTITTSGGEGNLTINGTEDFVIGGSVDVSITSTGGITATALTGLVQVESTSNVEITSGNDLLLTGNNVISIQGDAASAIAVQIQASDVAGGIDIDAGTAGIDLTATGGPVATTGTTVTLTASSGAVTVATTGDANAIVATAGGDVGIGDPTPSQKFTVGPASEFAVSSGGVIKTYGGAAPTDGQLLIGNTGGASFDAATLTAGTGIAITNGAGSITVATDGTGTAVAVQAPTTAFEAISAGALVSRVNDGGTPRVQNAEADVSGRLNPVGFAVAAAAANGDPITVRTSGIADVPAARFDSAPTAANVGQRVWMSKTAGKVTLDVSAFTTGDTVQRVGILADGSANPKVDIQIGDPILL